MEITKIFLCLIKNKAGSIALYFESMNNNNYYYFDICIQYQTLSVETFAIDYLLNTFNNYFIEVKDNILKIGNKIYNEETCPEKFKRLVYIEIKY